MVKMLRDSDRWALFCSIVLAVILALNGQKMHESVMQIVTKQEKITDNLRRWLASYKALQPIDVEWNDQLKSSASLDLLATYRIIAPEEAGLIGNADLMLVDKIDRIKSAGTEPGASAVTVMTAGKPGFVVTAPTWHDLINGLALLAARRDIQLQAVTIEAGRDNDAPTAIIHGLAIVLRDEEVKK